MNLAFIEHRSGTVNKAHSGNCRSADSRQLQQSVTAVDWKRKRGSEIARTMLLRLFTPTATSWQITLPMPRRWSRTGCEAG
jgi:hypothetical protein